jgi:hypothetical protein
VIRLVLQEPGTRGAIAVAELTKIRTAIQRRTGGLTALLDQLGSSEDLGWELARVRYAMVAGEDKRGAYAK